jgi:hypothetical protein
MRAVCFIGKFELLLIRNNYENQTSKSRTSQTRKTLAAICPHRGTTENDTDFIIIAS